MKQRRVLPTEVTYTAPCHHGIVRCTLKWHVIGIFSGYAKDMPEFGNVSMSLCPSLHTLHTLHHTLHFISSYIILFMSFSDPKDNKKHIFLFGLRHLALRAWRLWSVAWRSGSWHWVFWKKWSTQRRYPTTSPTAASSTFAPRPWAEQDKLTTKLKRTCSLAQLTLSRTPRLEGQVHDSIKSDVMRCHMRCHESPVLPLAALASIAYQALNWHCALDLLQTDSFVSNENFDWRSSVWLHSRGLEAHFSMLQQVRSNAILWLYVSSDWCSSAEIWYVLHYVDLKQGLDPISLRSPGLSVHVKLDCNQVLSLFLLQPVQGYINPWEPLTWGKVGAAMPLKNSVSVVVNYF